MTKTDRKSGNIDASTKCLSDCVKQLLCLIDIWKKTTFKFSRIQNGEVMQTIKVELIISSYRNT